MALSQVGLERLNTATTKKIGTNKNLIINGAMQVAQRGTSNTGLNGYGSVDRFFPEKHNIDNLAGTQQQSTVSDLPGFTKAFKLDITTQESALASDEYFAIIHRIEAQNLQHLAYGTSSATEITLSFYVKSSHNTGNFAVSIFQHDNSRLVSKTYTISSTNTWERKTLTFPAQTSGIINNDSGRGLDINWFLAAGGNFTSSDTTSWSAYSDAGFAFGQTANCIGQTGTFEITGVQLEVGSVATDFEHRSFGEELNLCKRYCQVRQTDVSSGSPFTRFAPAIMQTTSSVRAIFHLIPAMRAIPSGAISGNFQIFPATGFSSGSFALESGRSRFNTAIMQQSSGMSGTAGSAHYFSANGDATAKVTFDAEL